MLFSIVIPLYNKADTILRALNSIAVQSFKDYEVIVVDDGSMDKSASLVRSYKKIAKLLLIQQENSGVSSARNKGAAVAKGEYIAFLDADDCWMEDYLVTIEEMIKSNHTAVLVGTGFYWMTGRGAIRTKGLSKGRLNIVEETSIFQPVHTSSMVIRKTEFDDIGGFDEKHGYYEDVEIMFKIALRWPGAVFVNRTPLVCHMADAEYSITKNKNENATDIDYPHLRIIESELQLDGVGRTSAEYFARRFVLFTFAIYSREFLTVRNRMIREQFPQMVATLKISWIFLNERLKLFAWLFSCIVLLARSLALRSKIARLSRRGISHVNEYIRSLS